MHRLSTRGAALLALSALAGGLLVGCAGEPAPSPSWSDAPDAAEPLFASDEEALAAAEAAYTAYQTAFNVVAASGGEDTAGLEAVAHGAALERATSDAEDYRDAGLHNTGLVSFHTYKTQSLEYSSPRETSLVLYVCDDVSDALLWGANGESRTSADRKPLVPYEITVAPVPNKGLVLVMKSYRNGADFCSDS